MGAIGGNHYFGLAGAFIGFIVGIITGGFIGASVGSLIRKKR